jgi:hypothetical protein
MIIQAYGSNRVLDYWFFAMPLDGGEAIQLNTNSISYPTFQGYFFMQLQWMQQGTLIEEEADWHSWSGGFCEPSYQGYWNCGMNKYIGLLLVDSGVTHLGWIRLDVCSGYCLIKDYAYNSIENETIYAGAHGSCDSIEALLTPNDSIALCDGNSVVLHVNNIPNTSIQWLKNGIPIYAADQLTHSVTAPGNYSVVLLKGSCADTSNIVTVTIDTAIPTIILEGDSLFASSGINYQWYAFGQLLPGATNQFYIPTLGYQYTVVVTDSNGCTATSLPFDVISLNISPADNSNPSGLSNPYPNPTDNLTRIDYQLPDGIKQGELVFYNTMGTEVKRFKVTNTFSFIYVSAHDLASGTYYYNLQTSAGASDGKKMVVIR